MPCFTTTSGIVVSLFVVVSSCYAQRDCSFILHRSLVSLAGKYLSRRKWWFALSRRGRGTDIVVRLTSLRDVMTLPYGSGSGGRTMQGRCPCVICNIRWAYVVLVGWAMGDGRCAGDSPSSLGARSGSGSIPNSVHLVPSRHEKYECTYNLTCKFTFFAIARRKIRSRACFDAHSNAESLVHAAAAVKCRIWYI